MIWDRGRWFPEGDPHKGYAKGHLEFTLDGEKLHGRWHLVRMRSRDKDRHENWLLIKGKDEDVAQRTQPRYFGRGAVVGGDRPLDGRDRRGQGQEAGLAQQSRRRPSAGRSAAAAIAARIQGAIAGGGQFAKKEEIQIASQERRPRQSARPKRPPRRAAKPQIKSEGRSRGGRAQAFRSAAARRQKRPVARFHPAESGHAARRRAERPGMAARDQIRRLPHRGAARSRQGQAAHAQSARLDASLRADRASGRGAAGARPRSSTANWWSRTTRAFRVSRCCRPI